MTPAFWAVLAAAFSKIEASRVNSAAPSLRKAYAIRQRMRLKGRRKPLAPATADAIRRGIANQWVWWCGEQERRAARRLAASQPIKQTTGPTTTLGLPTDRQIEHRDEMRLRALRARTARGLLS